MPFKIAEFIGLFNFEWHNQTKIAILPFLRYGEIVKNCND